MTVPQLVVLPELLDINDLPAVWLENKDLLPNCSAVYFVHVPGEILYIGETASLKSRWATHHIFKDIKDLENVSISWLEVSYESLIITETAMIDFFNPRLNVVRRKRKGAL